MTDVTLDQPIADLKDASLSATDALSAVLASQKAYDAARDAYAVAFDKFTQTYQPALVAAEQAMNDAAKAYTVATETLASAKATAIRVIGDL